MTKQSNWPQGKLPGRAVDETGNVYGYLTALSYAGSSARNEAMWMCSCLCGREVKVSGAKLRKGHTRSCGCMLRGMVAQRNYRHGMSGHPLYALWAGIKARCTNRNNASYKYYGGIGVEMCDRWTNDFSAFVQDMGPRPEGASIDRIDFSGNYEPNNCRWASKKEQANNRSDNVLITHQGKTQTMAEWAEETGISYATISGRINRSRLPAEEALDKSRGLIAHNGKSQSIAKWASDFGINYNTLYKRIYRGKMPLEKALTKPEIKEQK